MERFVVITVNQSEGYSDDPGPISVGCQVLATEQLAGHLAMQHMASHGLARMADGWVRVVGKFHDDQHIFTDTGEPLNFDELVDTLCPEVIVEVQHALTELREHDERAREEAAQRRVQDLDAAKNRCLLGTKEKRRKLYDQLQQEFGDGGNG